MKVFGSTSLYVLSACAFSAALLFANPVYAQQGPSNLNISGGLFNPNGTPIEDHSVNFKLELWDPSASCLLYTEQHLNVDLSSTKGGFSFQLGTGTSQVNNLEGGIPSFDSKLFENSGATGAFTLCPSGVTLNAGDNRLIRVYYDIGSGFIAMTPDVPIATAPYSMIAETLQGKTPANFVMTNTNTALSQADVESVFTNTNYANLMALLNGTSTQYMVTNPGSPVNFNSERLINVAPPAAATDAANKNYVDTTLGGAVLDTTGTGSGVGNGLALVWNAVQNKWVAQALSGTVSSVGTGTGLLGGPITTTGTISVDVGTTANKILQLNALAQIPAVDGFLLTNLDAITGMVGDVTASGHGVVTSTIANNAVTLPKLNVTGVGGPGELIMSDSVAGTHLVYEACSVNQVLQWTAGGWACADVSAMLGNNGVAAGTYGSPTMVPQISVDLQGRVTALSNVNIAFPVVSVAGKTGAVTLNTSDISGLGTIANWDYGPTLVVSGTLINVDVGTSANQIVQMTGTGVLPAVDGSLLTNVNAIELQSRPVSASAPAAGEVLGWNASTSQWEPIAAAVGSVTNVSAGPGLLGGPITTTGSLYVDTGTTANKILQLNGSAQIPAVDGSLLVGVNASKIGTRTISTTAPGPGQFVGWNNTTSQWEPMSGNVGTVTGVVSGAGLIAGTITGYGTLNVDVGNSANQIVQFTAADQYPAVDGFQITNSNAQNIQGKAVSNVGPTTGQVLTFNSTTGKLDFETPNSGFVNSIVSGAGLLPGTITSSGTLNVDVGVGANQVVQFTAADQYPAVDGFFISNVNAVKLQARNVSAASPLGGQVLGWNSTTSQWEPMSAAVGSVTDVSAGPGLLGGPINSSGSLWVDTGTTANKIMQLTGSAQIPAVDGYLVTNSNAQNIQGRAVSNVGPTTGQVLTYNSTTGRLDFETPNTGFVTSIVSGAGLIAGTITSSGTLNVDVGNGANQVVQFTGTDQYPAVDGFFIANVNAVKLQARNVSAASPLGGQVLGWNSTTSQWEPMSAAVGSVTDVSAGPGLLGGPINSSGSLWVDTGTTANKIMQLTGAAQIPAVDGYLVTNSNAQNIQGRAVSNVGPTTGQVLTYNSTTGKLDFETPNTGFVTSIVSGAGLIAGTITSSGTLNVDVGNGANQVVQFTATDQYPAVDGFFIANVNAVKLQTRNVSAAAPIGGEVLAWNSTTSQWEPTSGAVGSVTSVTAGPGLLGGPINSSGSLYVDTGTTANKILQLNGTAQIPAVDGYLVTNSNAQNIQGRVVSNVGPVGGQVLTYNASSGKWEAETPNGNFVTSIVSGTGLVAGTITSNGTLNVDVGTTANKIMQFTVGDQYPAVDGFLIANVNAVKLQTRNVSAAAPIGGEVLAWNSTTSQWEPTAGAVGSVTSVTAGPGLLGGPINSSGSLYVDTGTTANKIMQLTGTAQIPAVDGYLVTNSNAQNIQGRAVSNVGPTTGQVLTYNSTTGKLDFETPNTGFVNSIVSGTGLIAGTITTAGTLNVDVGTTGNKIVQLTGGQYPAVDGSLITNVNAGNLMGKQIANASPASAQVLTYNTTSGKWDAEAPQAAAGVWVNGGNSFGVAGTLGTGDNNTLTFLTNNSSRMTIDTSGNVGIGTTSPGAQLDVNGTIATEAGGSAGTPSVSVVGAGGLYKNANGSIGLASNGSSVLVSFGGTIQIQQPIEGSSQGVYMPTSGAGLNSPVYTFRDWTSLGMGGSPSTGELSLITNSTAQLVVTNSGNVGIGTTSPVSLLDVNGNINTEGSIVVNYAGASTYGPGISFNDSSSSKGWLVSSRGASDTGNQDYLKFFYTNNGGTSWTSYISMDTTGKLAVGNTTAPQTQLEVATGTANDAARFTSGVSNKTYLDLLAYGGASPGSGVSARIGAYNMGSGNGSLLFEVNNSGSLNSATTTEAMRITNIGNVGIGTASPQAGLDVNLTGTLASAIIVPRDTTANRPSAPVDGMIRYNTSTNQFEGFVNGGWGALAPASGGSVTSIAAGPGLLGGTITTSGSLYVDVGTAANKIMQLTGAAQIPGVDGYLVTNVNAQNIQGRQVAVTSPTAGQVLTYNSSSGKLDFETPNGSFVTSIVSGTGLVAGTITSTGTLNVDVGTTGSKIVQLTGGKYPAIDGSLITNLNTASLSFPLLANPIGSAAAPAYSYNGNANTGMFSPAANMVAFSTAGTERMRIDNNGGVGIGTGSAIYVNSSGLVGLGGNTSPASTVDLTKTQNAATLFAINNYSTGSSAEAGFILAQGNSTYGTVTSSLEIAGSDGRTSLWTNGPHLDLDATGTFGGYISLQTGSGPTEAMRITSSGNVGIGTATPLAGLDINTTGTLASAIIVPRDTSANRPSAPVAGMIRYNTSLSQFEGYSGGGWGALAPASGGSVTSIIAGPGLLGGTISVSGSLYVDTGTAANKILQLTASAQIPGVDGYLVTNVNAQNIQGRQVAVTLPTAGQVLTYNSSSGKLDFETPNGNFVTSIVSGTGLVAGTIASTGTLNVDVGTTGSKIVQLTGGKYPAVDGSLITNINATSVSFPLLANPIGTAGAPAYSFSGNANTGLFSPAANMVALATAGSERMRIDQTGKVGIGTTTPSAALDVGSGAISAGSGSQTAPSYAFGGAAAQTGFFLAGANTIGWTGSGSSAGDFTSGGVNTMAYGVGFGSFSSKMSGNSVGSAADYLNLYTNNSERFRINGVGNVGIGTTSPQAGLDISTTGTLASAILVPRDTSANRPAGVNGMIRYNTNSNAFEGYANGSWSALGSGGTPSFPLLANPIGTAGAPAYSFNGNANTGLFSPNPNMVGLTTGGSERVRVDNLGNVGIGTLDPSTQLEVNGNVLIDIGATIAGNLSMGNQIQGITGTPANPSYSFTYGSSDGIYLAGGNSSHIIGFSTSGTERVRVDNFGNVGIGTATPLSLLQVGINLSAATPRQTITIGEAGYAAPSGSGSNSNGDKLLIWNDATYKSSIGEASDELWFQSSGETNAHISFYTSPATSAPSERMRIADNGNVGIGTSSPQAGLDINTTGTLASAIIVPRDTSANRPSTAVNGMIRYNTNTNSVEAYANGAWTAMAGAGVGFLPLSGGTMTGQLIGSDGSAAAPGFSFANDTGTGFYRSGASTIGIATGSSHVADFGSGGLFQGTTALGAAIAMDNASLPANPTYGFASAGGLGLFAPSSSSIAISTSSTERLRIDNFGDVGIGTTSPSHPLHVAGPTMGSGADSETLYVSANTSNTGANMIFMDNLNPTAQTNQLVFGHNGTAIVGIGSDWNGNGAGDFYIWHTGHPDVVVNAAGQVGIGTASPQAGLDVATTGTLSAILVPRDTSANRPTGVNGMIRYNTNSNGFEGYANGNWSAIGGGGSSSVGNSGAIQVSNGSGGFLSNNNIYVGTTNGQVGIGTATPNYTLDILSSATTTGVNITATGASGNGLTVNSTSATNTSGNAIYAVTVGTGSWSTAIYGLNNATTGGGIAVYGNSVSSAGGAVGVLGVANGGAGVQGDSTTGVSGYFVSGSATNSSATLVTQLVSGAQTADLFQAQTSTNGVLMNVTSKGYIGIGVATPQAALDVKGTGTLGSAIIVPRDTTANRPSTAVNGMIRYNTNSNNLEAYTNGSWQAFAGPGASYLALAGGTMTGPVLQANGTAAAPSYGFSADAGTGIYRVNAGTVGISSTSTLVGQFDANGLGVWPWGSVSNPSIEMGTTTAGLYVPASNMVAVVTGGTERIRIDNAGNFGVGTATPSYPLDVNGNINTNSNVYAQGNVDSNGGMFSAAAKGQTQLLLNSSGTNYGGIQNDAGNVWSLMTKTTGTTALGTPVLSWTAAGAVGIGSTTPKAALDITGTGSLSAIIVPRDTAANRPAVPVNGMIRYNTSSSSFEGYAGGNWGSLATGGGGSSAGASGSIQVSNGSGGFLSNNNVVVNTTNGYVGIGTTTPNTYLVVSYNNTATSGQVSGIAINSTYTQAAGTTQNTDIYVNRTDNSDAMPFDMTHNRLVDMYENGSNVFWISTAGDVEAYTLNANHPDTYVYNPSDNTKNYPASAWAPIQASNWVTGNDGQISSLELLTSNAAGTAQRAYIGAVSNTGASMQTPDVVVGVQTGSSSIQERMRIDQNGNVGIGTVSPRATLDITGTAVMHAAVLNSTATIDFSTGNIQYTASSCGAYNLYNLVDGGVYTFVLKGTTSGTCSFTAYSDAGHTSITMHLPPDNSATVPGQQTMYTFTVVGTDVYAAFEPGY